MNRAICIGLGVLAAGMAFAGRGALADVVVLKELNAVGYTYADTQDLRIERSSSSFPYNHGGLTVVRVNSGSSTALWQVGLFRFDLSALDGPGVQSVQSATLRLYATSSPTGASAAASTRVQQLTQSWVEGVSDGAFGTELSGASSLVRQLGTMVTPGELTSVTHNEATVYYIDLPGDPTLDPRNGTKHYIARATSGGIIRNWDVANNAGATSTTASGLLSLATDLDDLASKTSNTPWYYYDADSARLYTRFNNRNFMWFADDDLWADAVWDADTGAVRGPLDGSLTDTVISSSVHPTDGQGWFEYDISEFVTNWLVNGEGNFGVRVHAVLSAAFNFASSEQTLLWDAVNKVWEGDDLFESANGIYVQPELVINYTPVPEPATMGMLAVGALALGGVAWRRRRRG